MDFLLRPDVWITLLILTGLEIVLGIDNLIFLTITSSRLPLAQQASARRIGLLLALGMRLLLLALAFWLVYLREALFTVWNHPVSVRDLFLLGGGLFLVVKSFSEIKHTLHVVEGKPFAVKASTFFSVIMQIMLLDMVFSIDSVITAVGIAKDYWVMATAIIIAIIVMMLASEGISTFIHRYPRLRLWALYFLIYIGLMLMVEGWNIKVPHYFIFIGLLAAAIVEGLRELYGRLSRGKNKHGSH